jgi:hypothetical protein
VNGPVVELEGVRPLATSMQDIETEYNRVRQTNRQIGGVAFFSSVHKKSREWHVLGAVQQLLLRVGLDAPTSATESEAPDFHTYCADGRAWAPIEIVEVLRPDYKRHSSYKDAARPDAPPFYELPPPLEIPWEPLRNQIRDKARKGYPKGTCLVVYHDIGRMSFPDWNTPFHEQLLAEHAASPFVGVHSFTRVLVLTSDMDCLVQLHPTANTIVPDEGN